MVRIRGRLSLDDVGGSTRLWDWERSLVGPARVLTPVLALIGPRWERN